MRPVLACGIQFVGATTVAVVGKLWSIWIFHGGRCLQCRSGPVGGSFLGMAVGIYCSNRGTAELGKLTGR